MKRLVVFIVTLALALCVASSSFSGAFAAQVDREPEYKSFEDLSGKRICMLTGAPFEGLISSKVSDVEEFSYYASPAEMVMAIKTGKTDAGLLNTATLDLFINRDAELAEFPEPLKAAQFGIGFSKNYEDIDLWQGAFDNIDSAVIENMWDKWTGADEDAKIMPRVDWDGSAGTVRVAICDSMQPSAYLSADGQVLGMEAELILLLAKQLNYKVEFLPMEFSALIASVEAGKADMCAGTLIITEERQKTLNFVAYHDTAFVFVVRAKDSTGYSVFSDIGEKFKNTLFTDGRYKLILSGLETTLIISVSSGIIGLVAAYIMVSLHRRNIKLINAIIAVYCRLISGLPVVVILMILYYVVFASAKTPAVFVTIVGFSIIFAPKAYALIISGIESVDKGQLEAALALGYTEKKAYRRVILPQAAKVYFPLLRTQFALLVKETSVAGYIAVVDLTRAGDIIRGHTLEAFFPLLTVAIIYFVLTWLITAFIDAGKSISDRAKRRALL